MSLTKLVVVDLIEILENGRILVRTATKILDDGEILATNLHRHVVNPGDDYSNEDKRVKAVCDAVHTQEVINAYKAAQEASKIKA